MGWFLFSRTRHQGMSGHMVVTSQCHDHGVPATILPTALHGSARCKNKSRCGKEFHCKEYPERSSSIGWSTSRHWSNVVFSPSQRLRLVALNVSKTKKQTLDSHELLESILIHDDETASLSGVAFACFHSKRLWATRKLITHVKHMFTTKST